VGYSSNEGKMLTLAILNNDQAQIGNEVTFVWGEKPGTGSKPNVESHIQVEMRATVCPVPYVDVVREAYRKSLNKPSEAVAPI
jgi:syringate O-demethylase